MKLKALLAIITFVLLTVTTKSIQYNKILDFQKVEIAFDEKVQEANYLFTTQINEENIMRLTDKSSPDLFTQLSFEIYDTLPEQETPPSPSSLWSSLDKEESQPEYIIPPAKKEESTFKHQLYIKIALKDKTKPVTLKFFMSFFRELAWTNLSIGQSLVINRVYSQKKANFQIVKKNANYYFKFKAVSEKVDFTVKFNKNILSSNYLPEQSLSFNKGITNAKEWTQICKEDSEAEQINYMIIITIEGTDAEIITSDLFIIQVEELPIVAISSIVDGASLDFPKDELSVLKYINLRKDDPKFLLAETDLVYTLNYETDSSLDSIVEYRSTVIELPEVNDQTVFEKLLDIKSLQPEKLRSISNKQHLNYFRFNKPYPESNSMVKVILITLTKPIADIKMSLSLTKPINWSFEEMVASNEFTLKPHSINLIKLTSLNRSNYILISDNPSQRVYKGLIVTKENTIQEPVVRQVYNKDKTSDEYEFSGELTLEYFNSKEKEEIVKVTLQTYSIGDVVYRFNQRDKRMKVAQNCNGRDNELILVDVVSEVSKNKQWLVAHNQFGSMKFHYKNKVVFDQKNPKKFLEGTEGDETMGFDNVDSLYYIASIKCVNENNAYGYLAVQEEETTEETVKDIKNYAGFTSVIIKDKKQQYKISQEVIGDKPNLEVKIVQLDKNQIQRNIEGKVTVKCGNDEITLTKEKPIGQINGVSGEELVIESNIDAAIDINIAKVGLFTELQGKSGEKEEKHPLTSLKLLYKLTDPRAERYTITFSSKQPETPVDLSKGYYTISKGIDGFVSLPSIPLSSTHSIDNPFINSVNILQSNEFYYLAFYFEEPFPEESEVNLVISKQLFSIYDPLKEGTKTVIKNGSHFTLDYNTDTSKTHLILYATTKAQTKDLIQLNLESPFNRKTTHNIDKGQSKIIKSNDRSIVYYNVYSDIASKEDEMRFSYFYGTQENALRLNDLLGVSFSFDKSSSTANQLTWTKPEKITEESSALKYKVYISKELGKTDEIENEYQMEGVSNYEEIAGDKTEYTFDEEKYGNGTYAVNMMMIISTGGIDFSIAGKKMEVKVEYPQKPIKPNDLLWLWICLGVIGVVIIIIVIWLIARKTKTQTKDISDVSDVPLVETV